MTGSVDWSKVGQKAARAVQVHDDKKHDMIVNVGTALSRIFDNDPSDPRLEAIQVIIGIKPGGQDKAAELLGFSTPVQTQQSGPLAITTDGNADKGYGPEVVIHGDKVYLPEVDQNGVSVNGSHQLMENVQRNQWGLVVNSGLTYGFTRGNAPAPATTQAPTDPIPEWDTNGQATGIMVTVQAGKAQSGNKGKYNEILNGGDTIAFMLKPKSGLLRRTK